jgi:hypothetical protein
MESGIVGYCAITGKEQAATKAAIIVFILFILSTLKFTNQSI